MQEEDGADSLLLVLPSDHRFEEPERFCRAVSNACGVAENGALVTFGIRPSCAETGYGWIRAGESLDSEAFRVESFTEKPEKSRAQAMLDAGGHFWNSGIFLFRASSFLDELKVLAPSVWEAAQQAWAERRTDLSFLRPSLAFLSSPSVSVDHAEELTGLDFFSELAPEDEERLENQCNFSQWERSLPFTKWFKK